MNRFQEVKQHILECMLDKLLTYNPEIGATLEQYTERHVEESVRKFIRDNGSMYTLGKSYNEFKKRMKFPDGYDFGIAILVGTVKTGKEPHGLDMGKVTFI